MKKVWIFTLWLCTLLFSWNFTQANENYEFTNLDITARILKDWTVIIKEDYTANFFVERHWITRDIPLNYSVWWKDFHIYIGNIIVTWNMFTTNNYGDKRNIKIWDEYKTIIWEQRYPITYTTYGLIKNFSWKGYAELYWDLIWSQWNTNINKFKAEILLPKPYSWFTANDFLISIGSTRKSIEDFGWTIDRTSWDKIIITYNKRLPEYTKFTLSIKFPNNYFEFDHQKQAKLAWHIWNNYNSNGSLGFFSIQFIVSLCLWLSVAIVILFWQKINSRRKRSKIRMWIKLHTWKLKWKYAKMFPVIIQYDPPKRDGFKNFSEIWLISNTKKNFHYKWLNPAEVWLLLHRKAKAKDLFALIYKRTYEKLVEIKIDKDDSIIIKRLDFPPEYYPEYEKQFFIDLMDDSEIKITKGSNLFYKLNLETFRSYWVEKWWLKDASTKWMLEKFTGIVWPIWAIAVFTLILSPFIVIFFDLNVSSIFSAMRWYAFIWIFIFWAFSFIIMIILSSWMDKYKETEKWAKLISHILWYREFIAKCDENKLRTFLKQDPLYFDKILPYAVVFGLDTILIDKISPIMQDMNIESNLYTWDFSFYNSISDTFSSLYFTDTSRSSYSSGGWWDGWSSFDHDFGSDSWWGGWGWSDW